MGVRKFRGVEQMPQQRWSPRLDPNNLRQACALMVWARRLRPPALVPGLRKFRSASERDQEQGDADSR